MRNMGFYRLAEESVPFLDDEAREVLQAYTDGINDFIQGISLFGTDSSAALLPPEFYIFGMTDEIS